MFTSAICFLLVITFDIHVQQTLMVNTDSLLVGLVVDSILIKFGT